MNDLLPDYVLAVDGQELVVTGSRATESLLFVLRERLAVPSVKSGCEAGPFRLTSAPGRARCSSTASCAWPASCWPSRPAVMRW